LGDTRGYDRDLALFPKNLISYIKSTQPKAYKKMQKRERAKTDEVYMTTKLAGAKTFFLPFNKGRADGSAGNPPNPNGYASSYLWEEVLQRDSILNIISRYIHLEVKEKEDHQGKKSKNETLIFPRYHQLDVVRKLLFDTKIKGEVGTVWMHIRALLHKYLAKNVSKMDWLISFMS